MFELICLQAVETKAHLICSSLGRSWLNREGAGWGDIIDCLNCFHYTFAKSMTFIFYFIFFYRFCIPSIFVFCIIFYTHTAQSYLPVFYRPLPMISIMNCFFFIIPHIVPEGFMSSAAVFMLRKYILSCSILSFVCVIINRTTCMMYNLRAGACTPSVDLSNIFKPIKTYMHSICLRTSTFVRANLVTVAMYCT